MGEGASYVDTCQVQAWVSCNRDVNSAEWARALKVRQVLAWSIDRQKMINSLAFGEGEPAYTFAFMGHSRTGRAVRLGPTDLALPWGGRSQADADRRRVSRRI